MCKTFLYFNSFMAAEPNEIDVLILDEAHRIRETSANRYTKAGGPAGRWSTNCSLPQGLPCSYSTNTRWSGRGRWARSPISPLLLRPAASTSCTFRSMTSSAVASRWRMCSGSSAC